MNETTTGFHASTEGPAVAHPGLCITEDDDIAERYLEGQAGTITEVTIVGPVATQADLLRVAGYADRADAETNGYQVFELADMDRHLTTLASDGFAAVAYTDDAYYRTHECVRVCDPSAVTIGSAVHLAELLA